MDQDESRKATSHTRQFAGLASKTPPPAAGADVQASALGQALAGLKSIASQLKLYKVDSPQVARIGEAAHAGLAALLQEKGALTLSVTERGLLINGEIVPGDDRTVQSSADFLAKLIQDVRLESFTMTPQLGQQEMLMFVQALAHGFWELTDGKQINERLQTEGIQNVTVDEVVYVAVGEDDLFIKEGVHKLGVGREEVTEAMTKIGQVIDEAPEHLLGEEESLAILGKLLQRNPELMKKARERGMRGAEVDVPKQFSARQAEASLTELSQVMEKVSGADQEILQRIGRTIMGSFRHDSDETARLEQFARDRGIRLLPSRLMAALDGTADLDPAECAAALLSLESDWQVAVMADHGAKLIEQFQKKGAGEQVNQLLSSVLKELQADETGRREAAARSLMEVRENLQFALLPDNGQYLEATILKSLAAEKESKVYAQLAELTGWLIRRRIAANQIDSAGDMLRKMSLHRSMTGRAQAAGKVLKSLAEGEELKVLLRELRRGNEAVVEMIEALGPVATLALVPELIGNLPAPLRKRLAKVIGGAGQEAAQALAELASGLRSPTEAARLLDVLTDAVTDRLLLAVIEPLVQHQMAVVRNHAAKLLTQKKIAGSGVILLAALQSETEEPCQLSMITALGVQRDGSAVSVLVTLAEHSNVSDTVRAACCVTLGRIGDAAAIPRLEKLVLGVGQRQTRSAPAVSSVVRVGAARGLGLFGNKQRIRDALTQVAEDRDPQVRAAAAEALGGARAPAAAGPARPQPARRVRRKGFEG